MKTPRLLAAVIAAAALALTGCGRADTAAVVDGRVITESGLLAATEQLAQISPEPVTATGFLTGLVRLPIVLEVVGERGVTISDAAARSLLGSIDSPTPYLLDLARLDLAIGAMTQEDMAEVTSRLKDADIEVNPRYGTFDPEQVAVVATIPDWFADSAGVR